MMCVYIRQRLPIPCRKLQIYTQIMHSHICDVPKSHELDAGPRSAVGIVSGYRCVSDCRSRGREFDPGPVPFFRGD